MIQRDWTALETLAEVSRQIEASEKHDDRGGQGANGGSSVPGAGAGDRFEVQEQFTLENPPLNNEIRQQKEKRGRTNADIAAHSTTTRSPN
jgi:hypothetical protein